MVKKIVVIHVISDFFMSGADIVVSNIHKDFHDDKFLSHIVALNAQFTIQDSRVHCLGIKGTYNPISIIKLSRIINEIIKKNDLCDFIVHTHLTAPLVWTPIASLFFTKACKLVTTEHSTHNRRRESFWGRLIDFFIYKVYDRIVCISDGVRGKSIKYLPHIDSSKFVVIRNGIDLTKIEIPKVLSSKRTRLISIGRLERMKNYERVLLAVASIEECEFEYVIYGEGSQRKRLEELIVGLGLNSKVKLFGHCNNVSEILGEADLFVMPSLWEGFGLGTVEAMASGLPIIISNVEGLNEIILNSNEEIGYLIDPLDVLDIRDKILFLLTNVTLRRKLGVNAREESRKYSVCNTVRDHKKLYNCLLNENIVSGK
jgi:glycosyltransferase involved in cell wall biosynthesis